MRAFHASRRCIRYRADASTGEMRGAAAVLPQGRKAPWRSTPGCASQDFADRVLALGLYHEPFDGLRLVGFVAVWLALVVFAAQQVRAASPS